MTVSGQEYFPVLKNVCACMHGVGHDLKILLLCWLMKGKTRSSESVASWEEVIVEPFWGQPLQL